MNKFFTLVAFFCFIDVVNCQSKKDDALEISLQNISYNKKLAFNHISIIDSRFDTTKVGYVRKGNSYKKLVLATDFSSAFENQLNNYLKSNFDSSKNATLLIVIKNLWLNEIILKNEMPISQCIYKLELYLKTDTSYFPLIRIDSMYASHGVLKEDKSDLLTAPFEKTLTQLESISFEKLLSGRKLSRTNIEQYNNSRFNKPIFTAALQKGIYHSFKDFLENRLDSRPFEAEFGKLTDQLYLAEKGEKKLLTDFWAFCDGQKLYINGGFNFFELTRENNTFEFWGNSELIQYFSANPQLRAANNSAWSIVHGLGQYAFEKGINKLMAPKNIKRPFQLNMENGDIY